ncbi:MAG: Rpn family recombination-promoting nuclease/putative transposase [Moorea sp. SIO4G2]|uniref:Rpn family recombination-promoting nuclease/putative transposase n=1 Tax=Moorena bouillonii PNG TaxID=568701 RepID=A0A1U7N8G2_9CYAN|nr:MULTISPECIES: Rpn family recombination-promoting nuclease/putative transposase [Moorena]NEO61245.1 Rpn family recombination-promoting nuclease/putative transposase [Moorena sp. SIO4G2]NEO16813.1 Rpn family recombination-promoting nuclease/putative transposase [Moorena sp. SIO3E8]NEO24623.1 Rpn family recombination-promoting nuclease/putative transposase [Moorena sp. SIO4A5]NEP27532.1 Rpn family recombination-promoting nuclease/putative transposase [Moorena sp. SIO3I6]NEQ03391.1 Rpn family r
MAKTHIRFDWAIKKLLRDKANYVVLEGFITELLGEEITIESILEGESNRLTEDNKLNRVDILALNSAGELLLVEVQNSSENDYFHRMLFGVSTLLTQYLDKGEPYSKLKKVYSINIVYFTLGQGQDYIYEGKLDFRGRHHRDSLGLSSLQKELFKLEQVYQIFPEYYILRVNQFDNVTRNSLDEWIYFLKNSEIKEEFQARGLAEAKDKLRIESLPLPEKVAYQNYLENKRYEISLLEGAEAAGKLQGRAEKATEIAKAMKARGIDINLIVATTGLTKEDVEHF